MKIVEDIVNHIARPPRQSYTLNHLGKSNFQVTSSNDPKSLITCTREDISLLNKEGLRIEVSFFRTSFPSAPCLLYLHGSSSCRIEAIYYVNEVISQGWSYCAFDFAGSGVSQGETSGGGFKEAQDVAVVVSWLVRTGIEDIVIWGRSMGAVAAIIYASQPHRALKGLILDSAYTDLGTLIKEKAQQTAGIPQNLFTPVLYCIDSSLKNQIQVGLDDLNVKEYLKSSSFESIPAIFLVSMTDQIVGHHHSTELFELYPNPQKHILYIQEGHNEIRNKQKVTMLLETVGKWIERKEKKMSLSSLLFLQQSGKTLESSRLSKSCFKISLSTFQGRNHNDEEEKSKGFC